LLTAYKSLINLLIMVSLLGISLAIVFTSHSQYFIGVSAVASLIFAILVFDGVKRVRRLFFNVKPIQRYGYSSYGMSHVVNGIFKLPSFKSHPKLDLDDVTTAYYMVPLKTKFVDYDLVHRLDYYKWLQQVHRLQMSPHRHPQESPLSKKMWEKELGGLNKYEAYMWILQTVGAIDPQYTYHVKRLRMTPWQIILAADKKVEVTVF